MRRFFTCVVFLLFICGSAWAQSEYQPYSYQFYQKLDKAIYSPDTRIHSSLKPLFVDDSLIRPVYDSLMNYGTDTGSRHRSWVRRKVLDEHLFDVRQPDYTFFADYLPDLTLGRDFSGQKNAWLNTRGFQAGGTVGGKFYFYTSGFENQAVFPNYLDNYINQVGMIPGQAFDKSYGKSTKDWSYVTALMSYTPCKAVNLTLGEDKNFIGDGYRSVLLSDFAAPYPFFKVTLKFGNVEYMAMWAYMEDQGAQQFNSFSNNRRKWGAFHYIDWNVTNRLSLGFFNALIAEEADDQGKLHGFDVNYIDPIFFSSSLGPSGTAADHTLFGFNGKYEVLAKTVVYGQFLVDQGPVGAGNSTNAWQLGFRGYDLFGAKALNYLFEYNTASPYTYSSPYPIVNYAQLDEPLAHPFGANFREWLGILNYSIGRFDLQGQLNYARYGVDDSNVNYGKNIQAGNTQNVPGGNISTGQGVATSFKYAEGTVAYVINPKTNLRVEIGGLVREEKNSLSDTKTALFTVGLRSSFRDLYHDF